MREIHDLLFDEATKGMTAEEVLNYYRNLYHGEPQSTEHGVVAKALNDILPRMILLPYKCGTVVYVLRSQTSNGKNLYMRKEQIDHYRTFDNGTFMIFESGRTSLKNDLWSTSVFLTCEEAEQALKGGDK